MDEIRFANVSGQFYYSDPLELSSNIDELLVAKNSINKKAKALIVPHAGFVFSGKVAGEGYTFIKGNFYDEVFIFGTPHYSLIKDVRIANYKEWETPLGKIKQSQRIHEIVEKNKKNNLNIEINSDGFENEHSIEVQLPFLQKVISNNDFRIIPCLIGNASPRLLSSFFTSVIDSNDLIVVSTDLSHYYPVEIAENKDHNLIEAIISKDIDDLESNDYEACGINGIKAVTQLAIDNKWTPKLIKYDNSGFASGDYSRVVGYVSIAYF